MTTLTEAVQLILDHVRPVPVEHVDLLGALGRVIAEPVTAPWDLPMVDNSAMDGYAVRSADCTPGADLRITGYLPAGEGGDIRVGGGEAVRIMTGAPIPSGADAVVPVEECVETGSAVSFAEKVKLGQHIRFRGEDFRKGDMVIEPGRAARPAEINVLASFGKALVSVYRRPRVAIVATGDELVELGEHPGGGQVINSNSLAVAAAVREIGGEPILAGIARDNPESHRTILKAALSADAVITSAGVSAGDRDLVRNILAELGVEQIFWKVAVKPGGPAAFGMAGTVPVFSLPGNPVSTLLTFELLVRPALLKMMGQNCIFKVPVKALLVEPAKPRPDKTTVLRVSLRNEGERLLASSSGDQKTGFVKTLVAADGYILLEPGDAPLPAGTEVDAYLLGERQMMKGVI